MIHDISTGQKYLLKNYLFQASMVQFNFISFNFYENSRKTTHREIHFQVRILKFYKKLETFADIPVLFLLYMNNCKM